MCENQSNRLDSDNTINLSRLIVGLDWGVNVRCLEGRFPVCLLDVYYESRKLEVETRPIHECRCDERLKTKDEKSTRLVYTGRWVLLFIINR